MLNHVKTSVILGFSVKQAICSNTARVKFVHDACQSVRSVGRLELGTGQHVYDHILIDDANRMLFCDAPKTGSSFFKNLWLNYTRGVDGGKHIHQRSFLRKHNLRYLNSYNHSERLIRLKTYFKFMVARHPMVRVLSAYREKLELPNQYYHSFLGRPIERQYGHVPPRQSKGDNVTFEQMVRYLVDRRPTVYDHHWTPVSLLCKPCEIQYDYIARLETSNADYEHIFSKLKDVPGSKKGLPESVTTHKGRTDFDNVKNYYQQVPLTYINTLVEKYNLDFHLFGYTWNKTLHSYGCRMTEDGKECC